ncbi:hypothetical protein DSM3645_21057 [Blastopirellula marina DSM 3645]|uniref:Uncharacterized protein n=1 Tax=Blastopirellula marina DSM 3645 TaxID=314230 RepID=A3ZR08_9BACT|nr:hypothetical protein DSM3645_21057 [Blastopirellula marina DSM 3645]
MDHWTGPDPRAFLSWIVGPDRTPAFFRVGTLDRTGVHVFSGWNVGPDRTPRFFELERWTGPDSALFRVGTLDRTGLRAFLSWNVGPDRLHLHTRRPAVRLIGGGNFHGAAQRPRIGLVGRRVIVVGSEFPG